MSSMLRRSPWVGTVDRPKSTDMSEQPSRSIDRAVDQSNGRRSSERQFKEGQPSVRGVLVTSAKDVPIVGAIFTQFGVELAHPADATSVDGVESNEAFVQFEDLSVPSVLAIGSTPPHRLLAVLGNCLWATLGWACAEVAYSFTSCSNISDAVATLTACILIGGEYGLD
jgi:hypothetical protein